MDKQRISVRVGNTSIVDPPPATIAMATEIPTRRSITRSRVVKVFKRLRRKPQSNSPKRYLRSSTESLSRLDEEQSEHPSEVSGITDIVYDDDLLTREEDGLSGKKNWENGEEHSRNLTTSEPSPLLSPSSSIPSLSANSSSLTDDTLSESLGTWFDSLSSLAKSKEMDSFLHSSNMLVSSAAQTSLDTALNVGGIVVNTALLPVTLPLHVTATATDLIFTKGSSALHYFCDLAPIVVNHATKMPATPLLATTSIDPDTPDSSQNTFTSRTNTITTSSKSMATISTAPASTANQFNDDRSCYHRDEFLDRLRLDVRLNTTIYYDELDIKSQAIYSVKSDSLTILLNTSETTIESDFSKFLLRVDDVHVNIQPNSASDLEVRVFCLDLDEDCSEESLTSDALSQLAQRGVDIASSNEAVLDMMPVVGQEQANTSSSIRVDWKPLGQTKKDYKRLSQLPKNEFYDALLSHVFKWSGKYLGNKYHGSDNHFFMARGVVNGSPREVLNLLWDSERTKEYNKHCVKREDILNVINDETRATIGGFHGAKIIKSETKVPFTSLSVHLSALMYAKSLGSGPEDGFIIFSRSLNSGAAGYHMDSTEGLCESNNNQVIIGVNIMRPVPGRPDLSDLISISQVDASILPPFLKSRVGIMAVEDFFKNARKALGDTNN